MSSGKVHTVTGEIPPEELGITLTHEHLLFDASVWVNNPDEASKMNLLGKPVSMEILYELHMDPFACADNNKILDIDLAISELSHYKRAGGCSFVELTTEGVGRDSVALRKISNETGINIISGCGYYIDGSIPPRIRQMDADEIAQQIASEINDGVRGTGIRCGVIGEVGTSWPITPLEEKSLRAAARAQHATGVPINVHCWPFGKFSHRILDILQEEGADFSKVVLSHIDESSVPLDPDYAESLAKRGAYVEFSAWGSEYHYGSLNVVDPSDNQRVDCMVELIRRGYAPHLLNSQDICYKTGIKRFGGYGYDHILTRVVPMLKKRGITQSQIDQMMVANPRRVFAF